MSLEKFFDGFVSMGNHCVASFPVTGAEAFNLLKMLDVWNSAVPTLRMCKKEKGVGVVAGCSDFQDPPYMTVFYCITCDGTGEKLRARGVVLVPKNPNHELCANNALMELSEMVALEAAKKGLKLISL
jgi:hypothetical protein